MENDEPTSKKSKNSIDMLNGRILSRLVLFALPLMASGLLQLLFNAADLFVVGRFVGDNSLAAVGSTAPLVNLITNFFIGISVGANVVMARAIGLRDADKAQRTVHTAMLLGVFGGIGILLVGVFLSRAILVAMSADPAVIDKSALYMRIYFLGAPATMIYNFGAALLRAKGDTRRPLFFLVLAGVINVALNLLLVIVAKMDVAGVAVATIVSQYMSAVLVVICLLKESDFCKLRIKKLRFHKTELLEIMRVGVPSGLYSTFFSLSNITVQSAVNQMGERAVAGSAASNTVEGFFYTALNSIAQTSTAFVSQNYGASNIKRIKKVRLWCIMLIGILGAALAVVALTCSPALCGIFTTDPETRHIAATRCMLVSSFYALCGLMDEEVGSLRGIGYSLLPMIMSLVSVVGFRILWVNTAYVAVRDNAASTLDDKTLMLFACYPISWALASLCNITAVEILFRKVKKRMSAASAAPATENVDGATEGSAMPVETVIALAEETVSASDSISDARPDISGEAENAADAEEIGAGGSGSEEKDTQ